VSAEVTLPAFQFQYGTIKGEIRLFRRFLTSISIPVWYDYRKMEDIEDIKVDFISIPVWYD
jgi:hypothetical protein